MRLTRLYFCYGSVLTSALWLAIIIIYFSIQEKHISSPRNDLMIGGEDIVTLSQHTTALPDLDQLAIVRSQQDKMLRADGRSLSFQHDSLYFVFIKTSLFFGCHNHVLVLGLGRFHCLNFQFCSVQLPR